MGVAERQRALYWELTKRRSLQLIKEFDESKHPRNPKGEFTSGGGGGAGAQPKVTPSKKAPPTAVSKVNDAISAIPAAHREALRDVEMKVTASEIEFPVGYQDLRGGLCIYYPATGKQEIMLSSTLYGITNKNLTRTTVHELGHAYDNETGGQAQAAIPGIDAAAASLTPQERENAKYYLETPTEQFAELYSLAYSPDKAAKYFHLPYEKAQEVFKEPLAYIKGLGAPVRKLLAHLVAKARGGLLNTGLFVTDDGTVYAIRGGSPYEIDATGTPLMNLPSGDYTDEEVLALLRGAKKAADLWQREPHMPQQVVPLEHMRRGG